jgi:hypothetical protein
MAIRSALACPVLRVSNTKSDVPGPSPSQLERIAISHGIKIMMDQMRCETVRFCRLSVVDEIERPLNTIDPELFFSSN